MTDLIDTTEMYLRTILELEEEGVVPLRARISERLGHSGPTVSQTVARMERDDLVIVSNDRHLELTDKRLLIQLFDVQKHRLELEAFSVYQAVYQRVKLEGIVGTRRVTKANYISHFRIISS